MNTPLQLVVQFNVEEPLVAAAVLEAVTMANAAIQPRVRANWIRQAVEEIRKLEQQEAAILGHVHLIRTGKPDHAKKRGKAPKPA